MRCLPICAWLVLSLSLIPTFLVAILRFPRHSRPGAFDRGDVGAGVPRKAIFSTHIRSITAVMVSLAFPGLYAGLSSTGRRALAVLVVPIASLLATPLGLLASMPNGSVPSFASDQSLIDRV